MVEKSRESLLTSSSGSGRGSSLQVASTASSMGAGNSMPVAMALRDYLFGLKGP
jgi:hypothetical protein